MACRLVCISSRKSLTFCSRYLVVSKQVSFLMRRPVVIYSVAGHISLRRGNDPHRHTSQYNVSDKGPHKFNASWYCRRGSSQSWPHTHIPFRRRGGLLISPPPPLVTKLSTISLFLVSSHLSPILRNLLVHLIAL